MGLTLENWNSFDNGHTLLEVDVEGKWCLFDPTFCSWISVGGKLVSLVEATSSLRSGSADLQLEPLMDSSDSRLSSYAPRKLRGEPRFESSLFFESNYFFPGNDRVSWYQRVLQVPGIQHEGSWSLGFETEKEAQKIRTYSSTYNPIPMRDFLESFYPYA